MTFEMRRVENWAWCSAWFWILYARTSVIYKHSFYIILLPWRWECYCLSCHIRDFHKYFLPDLRRYSYSFCRRLGHTSTFGRSCWEKNSNYIRYLFRPFAIVLIWFFSQNFVCDYANLDVRQTRQYKLSRLNNERNNVSICVFTRCDVVGIWSREYQSSSNSSSSSSSPSSSYSSLFFVRTYSSHVETDDFDHDTFHPWWNWPWYIPETDYFGLDTFQSWWSKRFWPWRIPDMLKLTIWTMTHFRHAETDDSDEDIIQTC
jgi:hypothetical protein